MCDQARYELAADARAAGVARRLVGEHCGAWSLPALRDDAVLTTSELVANAVVHTGGPATLTVSLSGEYLEIAVRDDSPREPIVRPARANLAADLEATSWHVGDAGHIAAGRGMLIVDAVADEWGIVQLSAGKHVWFRLRIAPEARRADCPCPGGSLRTPGGLTLGLSGARIVLP